MPAIQIALSDASHVNGRIRCAYIKQANKETCLFGFTEEIQFLIRRKNSLKYEITPLFQTFIAQFGSMLCSFNHSLRRVPVTKHLLSDIIRVDIQTICSPLVIEQLDRSCRFARTIRTGNNAECRTFLSH